MLTNLHVLESQIQKNKFIRGEVVQVLLPFLQIAAVRLLMDVTSARPCRSFFPYYIAALLGNDFTSALVLARRPQAAVEARAAAHFVDHHRVFE